MEGKGVRALLSIATLTSLDLNNSNIDPVKAAYFLNCPALRTLVLDTNPLGDEGALRISQIPNVTDLNLGYCEITSQGAAYFLTTRHLEKLNLESNEIGDEGADLLSKHPQFNQSECT